MAFDPVAALRALVDARVRFVVVGGFAAALWGSPSVTGDLDVCYARDPENLERLAEALRAMGARLRGVAEDVPFLLEGATIAAGDAFTLQTDHGGLDILGSPAGSGGYDELIRTAERMGLGEVDVWVASLPDLMAMKLAARRPKDLAEAEILGALMDEVEKQA